MNVTIDTNCIIDYENQAGSFSDLRRLVVASHDSKIHLRVVAISAAENQQGQRLDNFSEFQARLQKAGLGGCEIILPMGYLPLCYMGHFLLMEDNLLERNIHDILFPDTPFEYAEFCRIKGIEQSGDLIDSKWANKKCDVQCYWSHCYHGGGIFVTSDGNFHKQSKKGRLEDLGNSRILKPDQVGGIMDTDKR